MSKEAVKEQRVFQAVGANFRRLVLWQKAQALAVSVAKATSSIRRDRAADVIVNQLLRSASSIAANIAEGYGRYSQAAYRNHVSIARGSAFEVESWLDLLMRPEYISQEQGSPLMTQVDEVQRLLTLKMKSLGGKQTYAVGEEAVDYDV